jgi:uncharacterized RDD family membrane protein YckC
MDEQVYRDPGGRPYAVRDGVSVWLPEYVDFAPRVLARVIDIAFVNALGFAGVLAASFGIGVVVTLAGRPVGPVAERLAGQSLGMWAVALVAAAVFETVAEGMHGSTPGKMILGLTVRADDCGFCGVKAALIRSFGYFVDGLVLGMPALMSMSTSPRRQRLGDKWARTVVVRTRSLDPSQLRPRGRFLAATGAAAIAYLALMSAGLLLRLL